MNNPKDIDDYIARFPKETQKILEQVRATVKEAAPGAEEAISYGIPTLFLNGNLVHFAGYKNHIGFYPTPSAITAFAKELSKYEGAKGSVKFPIDKPIPLKLISTIVKFRMKEAGKKATAAKHNFLSMLSAPAKRALENKKITTLKKLSRFTEDEILALHGMGPGSMPGLHKALAMEGLSFKEDVKNKS